ncbi:hypothetical protein FGO68_gene2485 [Halteria grandinella]|uniref:Uncharacterized protein n=1 Tax=Halteria grandinella TaxID=5974 RepID=A0A8J8NGB4_HALGN|nr:hypothetical protein FGO68_gene2485 [Halteria grandinella]
MKGTIWSLSMDPNSCQVNKERIKQIVRDRQGGHQQSYSQQRGNNQLLVINNTLLIHMIIQTRSLSCVQQQQLDFIEDFRFLDYW